LRRKAIVPAIGTSSLFGLPLQTAWELNVAKCYGYAAMNRLKKENNLTNSLVD
jgi:hypothetical protein